MLRARKVMTYVAERIESDKIPKGTNEEPETWLELLCQEKVCRVFSVLTIDCSCKVDIADDSGPDVETGRGHFVYLSVEVGDCRLSIITLYFCLFNVDLSCTTPIV